MDPRFGDVPPTGIKSPLGHFFDLSSLAWIFTFREYLTSRVGDAIRARAAAGTPPSRAHSPPGCPAPRELVASGNVADGNRQLVWNPEFREPAVKRLAEVSDSLFWSLPLAVSTAARQRRAGGPPASFILFHGVRHVHNTVHEADHELADRGRRRRPSGTSPAGVAPLARDDVHRAVRRLHGFPRRLRHPGCRGSGVRRPAQLTDLVMWAACPPGEHGLRGGKWDHVGGPWRGERS